MGTIAEEGRRSGRSEGERERERERERMKKLGRLTLMRKRREGEKE